LTQHDAVGWMVKFTFWTIRPFQVDRAGARMIAFVAPCFAKGTGGKAASVRSRRWARRALPAGAQLAHFWRGRGGGSGAAKFFWLRSRSLGPDPKPLALGRTASLSIR